MSRTPGEESTPSLSAPAGTPGSPSSSSVAPPGTALPPPTTRAGSTTSTPRLDRPAWLGTRILPRRSDGFGEVQPTPPELRDRRLPSPDLLPAPHGGEFSASVQVVPGAIAARSTWSRHCPVPLEELRYVTLVFWGFDERPHTGELLVHESVAEDVVAVFRRLYRARFPIEEMRVVSSQELVAAPTGDGNNTTSFVCRPTTGGTSWSEHAYGLAVDINPFHNPYTRGDLVVPELASAYTQRGWRRQGMIQAEDEATASFARIGWGWG
ncbi:MAG: M15 family metallopeptidase, partial [Actinomycetota bacterium]|nr:M15 family metallopeptidase [Actinomycetota bacterium]